MRTAEPTGPLSGLTVIEFAAIGPAPLCATVLADLGAAVVRVDRARKPRSPVHDPRRDVHGRSRRSICIDLKQPRGVEAALTLVERADVVIEGFRPDVMERLGLGPDRCLERNERLVYGRVTGWGRDGPLAHTAGHDIDYIALSGLLHGIGSRDGGPIPPLNVVGDYGGGGMLLAVGVLSALFEVARSGQGQVVDAAMVDGAALLGGFMRGLLNNGQWVDERESNVVDGAAHFYGTYETADGKHVAVGAIEEEFYLELVARLGLTAEELPPQRDASAWPGLRRRFADIFARRTRDEWSELLGPTDACLAPVLSIAEAPLHPHNVHRDVFVEVDGDMQPAPAPRFDRTPASAPRAAPRLGEHSREILREAGLRHGQIAELLSLGAITEDPEK